MCRKLGRYKHLGSKLKLNARRQTEELYIAYDLGKP